MMTTIHHILKLHEEGMPKEGMPIPLEEGLPIPLEKGVPILPLL